MNDQKKIICVGIDLGTVNSCLAIYDDNKIQIVETRDGRTTPSYVYYDPKSADIMVGKTAMVPALTPENAIFDSKRFIGRDANDPIVGKIAGKYSFEVVLDGNQVKFEISSKKAKLSKTPQDVSAEVLRYFKNCAVCDFDADEVKAVITVPAYFNNTQKKATMEAAELAGLQVLQLISEPTAAGIFYYHQKEVPCGTILVFDFGGGTFDVSIIELKDSEIKVKCVDGDGFLGGRNIDENILNYIQEKVLRKDKTLIQNWQGRLRRTAEDIKMNLSTKEEYQVTIECLYDDDSSEVFTMSREIFEELNENIFGKCVEIVDRCLRTNNLMKSDIDEVVLVGGSTKIPAVKRKLQEYFDGKSLVEDLNPDEIVAAGASIQAYRLNNNDKAIKELTIVDVTPFSIGNAEIFNCFTKYIEANTPIPVQKIINVSTCRNNQEEAVLQLFEGEWTNALANHNLGTLSISNLPKGPAGSLIIKVALEIDQNRILNVSTAAQDLETKTLTVALTRNVTDNKTTQNFEWDQEKDIIFYRQCKIKQCILTLCNKYIYKHPEEETKFENFLETLTKTYENLEELKEELKKFMENFENPSSKIFERLFKYVIMSFDEDLGKIEIIDGELLEVEL